MQHIDLNTVKDKSTRKVTIWFSYGEFTLLGGLEHGTKLLIDQAFIDGLQKLLDYANKEV
jgi:hypothetical protein